MLATKINSLKKIILLCSVIIIGIMIIGFTLFIYKNYLSDSDLILSSSSASPVKVKKVEFLDISIFDSSKYQALNENEENMIQSKIKAGRKNPFENPLK